MSIRTIHKTISIDKFMDLWDKAYNNQGDDIFPGLGDKLKEKWKWEIIKAFNMAKTGRSWGPLAIEMLAELAKAFQEAPRVGGYRSRAYVRDYPDTYKKTGQLYRKMKSDLVYYYKPFGNKSFARFKIVIPFKSYTSEALKKTRETQAAEGGGSGFKPQHIYRYLEEQRSFVKGAFLKAWPDIFDEVIKYFEDL
jgi:hypothetical protein